VPAAERRVRFADRVRAVRRVGAVIAVLPLAAACHSGSPTAQPTVTVTSPVTAPVSGSAPPSTVSAGAPPGIVAVTAAGALVTVDPATGSIGRTLVPAGVQGDEISVSPDGSTVYFTQGTGCHRTVASVGIAGGSTTSIAPGELPAISPDGSKLAFAREPVVAPGCLPNQPTFAAAFKLVIRTLGSGAEHVLPQPPQVVHSGLPRPISHLSWAPDNTRLAVSISAIQDNEGWGLYIVDTAVARYYLPPAAGVTYIPVTGSPNARDSYIREGAFLPDGNLFISRACCGGVPIRNTSKLMWEVAPSGQLLRQVAIGYPNLDHLSLAVDPRGQWLLYLAGHDLYVSKGGNRPTKLTSGLIAATWV